MRAIIGLGNPGSEYDGTRHNIGFAVIDRLAAFFHIRLRHVVPECLTGNTASGDIIFVKPMTYMNNSGCAVKTIIEQFEIAPVEILVITDDFHIPLGTMRLRQGGSDGGHNGLASIIHHLGSSEFPRLRCGIDNDTKPVDPSLKASFVLSVFEKSEKPIAHHMIECAADVAATFARENFVAAQRRLSIRKS